MCTPFNPQPVNWLLTLESPWPMMLFLDIVAGWELDLPHRYLGNLFFENLDGVIEVRGS